jgi:hypothetical protein
MDNNNPPNRAAGTHQKYVDALTTPSYTAGSPQDMAQLMGFINRKPTLQHKYDFSDIDPETGMGPYTHAEDCPACNEAFDKEEPYGGHGK